MPDEPDPILKAVEALRAAGIEAAPHGDDFERWKVGDLIFTDAGILQLATAVRAKGLRRENGVDR